ncbi:MAG: hypothetical protein H0W72_11910 [Planctomycetes bacterium]|nr:hypothetical protein [Planctomycetota bacterium]
MPINDTSPVSPREAPATKRRPWARIFALSLLMLSAAAGEDGEAVRSYLVSRAEDGLPRPVTVTIVSVQYRDTTVLGADPAMVRLRAGGADATLPWKLVDDRALYELARQIAADAPAPVLAAWLRLGIANGRDRDPDWRNLLSTLRVRDPGAAETVVPTAAATAPSPAATASPEGAAAGTVPEGASDEAAALGDPANLLKWDKALFDAKGHPQLSAVLHVLAGEEPRDIERRLGPAASFFASGVKAAPRDEIFERPVPGVYLSKAKSSDAVDWTGMGGQILFVPSDHKVLGIDRVRFCWSNHENHGGGTFWHEYLLNPTRGDWWCAAPDPALVRGDWREAGGGALPRPVALARSNVSWSNCAILVFANGLIGATGYGNNDDRFPTTTLPVGKVPTAVALTPNNEFALITVIDTKTRNAQLAVVALEARALPVHNWWYAGMPSSGCYTRLKLLGLIDLPESVRVPSAIATTSDVARFRWATPVSNERVDDPAVRQRWAKAVDSDHRAASAGSALVVSRAESKACLIDLTPLYQHYGQTYFGDRWTETKNEGPAADQWPFAFEKAPAAKPRVGAVVTVAQPNALAAGYAEPVEMKDRYFIGTLDGRLLVLSAAGGLAIRSSLVIGRNPTCIALGRHSGERQRLFITCRGDAEVVLVDQAGSTPVITARLRDRRLIDPVSILPWDTRGASGFAVADYAGGAVRNYLYAPIISWGDRLFGGLGADGKAAFEHTGSLSVPGRPYLVSFAEVN